MMRKPFGRAAAALVLAATAATSEARAGDPALAESLFKEGSAALKKEDWKAACDAFGGSNDADPSPGTQINLGLCNERQGKTATGWGWYSTAAGTADTRGQRERAELARREADRLAKVLSKLTIVLEDTTPGVSVTRDGASLPPSALGREVPVDPGEHVIEATAKGKVPFKTIVRIPKGPAAERLVIKPLAAAADEAAAVVAPGKGGSGATGDKDAKAASEGSGQRTAGYLVGAGGVVALIVAGTLQVLSSGVRTKQEDAQKQLDLANNPPLGLPKNEDRVKELTTTVNNNKSQADGNQIAAIAVGAGGLVLIGTGLVLIFTAPSGKTTADSRPLPVTPTFGPGFAGLATSFAF
jgi:hypothetical protein